MKAAPGFAAATAACKLAMSRRSGSRSAIATGPTQPSLRRVSGPAAAAVQA